MSLISDEFENNSILPAECTRNNTYLLEHIPDDEKHKWFYSTFQIFILLLQQLISCFGLIGNFAVLVLIAYRTDMRTITNFYIGNLAVSDVILTVSLTVYLSLTYFATSGLYVADYAKNSIGCFMSIFPFHIGYFSSIGFVVLVSIERFMAICFPVKHRVVANKGRALRNAKITWTFSIILAVLVSSSKLRASLTYCAIWTAEQVDKPLIIFTCESLRK